MLARVIPLRNLISNVRLSEKVSSASEDDILREEAAGRGLPLFEPLGLFIDDQGAHSTAVSIIAEDFLLSVCGCEESHRGAISSPSYTWYFRRCLYSHHNAITKVWDI